MVDLILIRMFTYAGIWIVKIPKLYNISIVGEVAEWFKAHPWKGCMRGTASRVRISPSPPILRFY